MTTLLVASGGGHLKQLHRLLPRLDVPDERLWVTFETGLSRSLLSGEDVVIAPYAHPHDIRGTLRDIAFALKVLRRHSVHRVISTGANLAVAFLPAARLLGARCEFIETATRAEGPSLTGRILRYVPGMNLYTQHRSWARAPWTYGGSVFDGFGIESITPPEIKRIVVTLGSNGSYPFDRLVSALQRILPPEVDVLWQLGSTRDPGVDGRRDVPSIELEAAMRQADVVVAHAGTGAALSALECGKCPLLVPRRREHGEHIDDHQEMTAKYLSGLGLAVVAEADELNWADLLCAATRRVFDKADAPSFKL